VGHRSPRALRRRRRAAYIDAVAEHDARRGSLPDSSAAVTRFEAILGAVATSNRHDTDLVSARTAAAGTY
jgi:hypothetical protein